MSIYRGAGGSGDATNDATVSQVQTYASQAATSATNAASSATAAAASASGASTSASLATSAKNDSVAISNTVAGYVASALASEAAASGSATSAAASAVAAALSEGGASGSASDALDSANTATTQATAASTSATNSANSAASALAIYGNTTAMNTAVTNAGNSATSAATSATNAATSASAAAGSASAASSSASAASTSASAAATSAGNANTSASNAATSEANTLSIYGSISAVNDAVNNSLANRNAAATSATSASTSASASATSATSSATSASAAATSAAAASAVALGNEPVRHSVRPSLLLDFANTKQLDPRITFTRASTATFYDGKTTAKAEENLLLRSQEFDNGVWGVLGGTLTANAVAAPDGTTTAESFATNTGNARIVNAIALPANSIVSGNTYTLSIFAQNVSGSGVFRMYCAQTAAGFSSDFTATSVWQRFSFTFTANATGNDIRIAQVPTAGDLISVWGAQLEQRSTVTAYTPTTTAAITNYIPALQTAASGVPRFDHNPTTGESLGLLIEEQRVNLQTYSEQFESVWTKNNTSVSANATIAPDGIQTADKLIATATTSFHLIQGVAVTGTGSHTMSVYAKAGEYSRFAIRESNTTGHGALFDLLAGTVLSTNGGAVATITPVGNGWYRCTATVTWGTSQSFGMTLATNTNTTNLLESFTGNGFSGLYIWGAQLEAGAFATSYIPTVASQVTRSPDAASMTGTNFSSWYRGDANTIYSEYTVFKTPDAAVNSNAAFGYGDGTNNEYAHLDTVQGTSQIRGIVRARATTYSAAQGTITVGTTIKAALALSTGNGAFSANGATATAVNPAAMPLPTFANIGKNTAFSVFLNGQIKKVAFYPIRLTNAEIQSLTTV